MIGLRTTLRCSHPPRHIWIVLSDPAQTGGEILLVNLTTLTEDCVDDGCLLGPTDYILLSHETTVAYSRAQAGPVAAVEDLVRKDDFSIITEVPVRTLEKILKGARESRELSAAMKKLVASPSSFAK